MYGNFASRDASRDMAEQSFYLGIFYYGSYLVHCIMELSSPRDADPDRPTFGQVGGPPPR